MRLLARIKNGLGSELPLAALFAGPTVAGMAEALRKQAGPLPATPLVPIQPHGSGTPLFFVHPIGGNAMAYYPLAQHLGTGRGAARPIYAIQGDDEDGERRPPIEELAGRYVGSIRERQPNGPYLLGGWSFGGTVAFEMARQLRAAGQEVALVALLDTRPPGSSRSTSELDPAEVLAWIAGELARDAGHEPPVSGADLRPVEAEARLALVAERLAEVGVELPEGGIGWVRRFLASFVARIEADHQYRAGPYDGRIALFRATEPEPYETLDERVDGDDPIDFEAGWQRLNTQRLTVIPVPGHHSNMVLDPQVAVLAEHLAALIAEVMVEQPARADAADDPHDDGRPERLTSLPSTR
jgi:thioesterase domain-containing protein